MSVPWPFVTFRFYRIWLIEQMGGQNGWILTRFFICMFYARRCSPSRNTELHIKGSLVTAMKTVTYVLYFHLGLLLTEQIKAVRAYCSVICYKLLFFLREEGNIVSLLPHIFGNLSFHWHSLFFSVFLQVFGSNGNVSMFSYLCQVN